MLVLTRKVGDQIVIGDNIRLAVVDIRGGTVRIGVSAPKEIRVDRQEVHEKRQNFQCEAPVLTPMPVAGNDTTPP